MTGCLLDVVVILIFGQMHFISWRESPPFTPFIIVYGYVLRFIFLSVLHFKRELNTVQHVFTISLL